MDFLALPFNLNRKNFFHIISVENGLKQPDVPFECLATLKGGNYILPILSPYRDLIKKALFDDGFKGVAMTQSVKDLKPMEFQEIATEEKTFGYRFFNGIGNLIRLKSFDCLCPNIELDKIDNDPTTAMILSLKARNKAGLGGFSMAGACFTRWKKKSKQNCIDLFGYKYNYRHFDEKSLSAVYSTSLCGLNWINPDCRNIPQENIICIDVNSLYPWIALTRPLPDRAPIIMTAEEFKNQKRCELGLFEIYVSRAEIKPGFVPFIQPPDKEGQYSATPDCFRDVTLFLWNEELNAFKLRYTGSYIVIKVLAFQAIKGNFDSYFNPLISKKEIARANKNYLNSYLAKSQMNLLLGKFASPYEHIQRFETRPGQWQMDKVIDNFKFVPLFSYIVSQGRLTLEYYCNCILGGRNNVIYTDTDSAFIRVLSPEIPISDTKLGYFKIDKLCSVFSVKARKAYSYIDERTGSIENVVAGADMKLSDPIDPYEFVKKKHGYYHYDFKNIEGTPTEEITKIEI